MPHCCSVHWATIIGNSITPTDPISPSISWVVKDLDCLLKYDKSTSTPRAFAPAATLRIQELEDFVENNQPNDETRYNLALLSFPLTITSQEGQY